MKTYSATPGDVERGWYVVDASGRFLGQVDTQDILAQLASARGDEAP